MAEIFSTDPVRLSEPINDVASVRLDAQGIVRTWSASATRTYGYTAEDIVGKPFSIVYSAEDCAKDLPRRSMAMADGAGTFSTEGWRLRKDGSLFWAEETFEARRCDQDSIDFIMITYDGTRHRAEVSRLERRIAVLDLALSHARDAICLFDADERLVLRNRHVHSFFGVADDVVLEGRTLAEICRLAADVNDGADGPSADVAARRYELHRKALDEGDAGAIFEKAHGRVLRVLHHTMCDGSWVSTISDVTEQAQASVDVARANAKLQTFIKHAPASVAMLDRDMRYVAHSDRWLSDFNIDGAPIIGRHHYDVFPEMPERWKDVHQRCMGGAVESCVEDTFDRFDGSRITLKWDVRPWFHEDEQIGGIVMLVDDVSVQKATESNLRQLANIDSLTQLPNRTNFYELLADCLTEAAEGASSLAVGLLDLDRFKEVNDVFGHDAGDQVLRDAALRLRRSIGAEHIVARLGGDEFALVFRDSDTEQDIASKLDKVYAAFEAPFDVCGTNWDCGMSIGVTFAPRDGTTGTDLLKNADLAMYAAKRAGANGYRFFDETLRPHRDSDTLWQASSHGAGQRRHQAVRR